MWGCPPPCWVQPALENSSCWMFNFPIFPCSSGMGTQATHCPTLYWEPVTWKSRNHEEVHWLRAGGPGVDMSTSQRTLGSIASSKYPRFSFGTAGGDSWTDPCQVVLRMLSSWTGFARWFQFCPWLHNLHTNVSDHHRDFESHVIEIFFFFYIGYS